MTFTRVQTSRMRENPFVLLTMKNVDDRICPHDLDFAI